MAEPIEKVSIVVSHGSLEGVYPALIMANGARMEGIEATLFFTFFGLDAIIDKRMDSLSVATVGNSAMRMPGGLKMPTLLGAVPGMSRFATTMMSKEMEKLDIPPVREFIEMIHDAGGELYACWICSILKKKIFVNRWMILSPLVIFMKNRLVRKLYSLN
jgi:peroxiredoxin family protein